jgi:hypothetical protein
VLTAEIYRRVIELMFCTVDSIIIVLVSICFLCMRREQIIFLCCERWNAFIKISPSRSVFKHLFESVLFKADSFLIHIRSVKGNSTIFSAFYCLFADVDSRAVNAIYHCTMYIYYLPSKTLIHYYKAFTTNTIRIKTVNACSMMFIIFCSLHFKFAFFAIKV